MVLGIRNFESLGVAFECRVKENDQVLNPFLRASSGVLNVKGCPKGLLEAYALGGGNTPP